MGKFLNNSPVTPIRDASKECIILCCAHGINGNVEVPVLAHVVHLCIVRVLFISRYHQEGEQRENQKYLRSSTLLAMAAPTQRHARRTLINYLESERLR